MSAIYDLLKYSFKCWYSAWSLAFFIHLFPLFVILFTNFLSLVALLADFNFNFNYLFMVMP